MKTLTKYFLQGALVLAPIAVTVYVIYWLITSLSALAAEAPVLTLPLALAVIVGVGYVVQNVVGSTIVQFVEDTLRRVPLIGLVYASIRDLLGAFVGDKKNFDKPVAVQLTQSGTLALGFITREHLNLRGLEDHVAVYLPQSYNFAGNLVLVRRDQVQPLDVTSTELMQLIVSGAISGST